MRKELVQYLACPRCQNKFALNGESKLICSGCGYEVKLLDGLPLFTDIPVTIQPWEKVERGPDKGTAWRRSNWMFLNREVQRLSKDNLILDVGAGHGDFADIFSGLNYFAMDIVPYAEVDLVCDLGQVVPFKAATFDTVVLMNVLEHVYENRRLVQNIASLLKPGGKLILTVPFLLKVHQAPFDFSRYTPYYLEVVAKDAGLTIATMNGYYDPLYLLNESLGNLWLYAIDSRPAVQRYIAKGLVFIIQRLINLLGEFVEKGTIRSVMNEKNPAPVGYLVVLEKKA